MSFYPANFQFLSNCGITHGYPRFEQKSLLKMCLLLKTELQQFTFIRLHFYFFIFSLLFERNAPLFFASYENTASTVASRREHQPRSVIVEYESIANFENLSINYPNEYEQYRRLFLQRWFLITRRNSRGEQEPGKKTRKPRHTGFNQRRCATMRTMGNEN